MEKYFIITNCDGDTFVSVKTKEELLNDIKEGSIGCESVVNYVTEDELDHDTNYWGGQPLIIKGTIVEPKPIKVVTDFDID